MKLHLRDMECLDILDHTVLPATQHPALTLARGQYWIYLLINMS